MTFRSFLRILGPGLLYAGAAVGVSHLVQSTRAGADYGFELLWILIFANAIKYPFFEFGPRYAAITGRSLIDGYRQIGKWAVILFAILTIGTMFTIQAAVTIVTAALVGNVLNLAINPVQISAIILLFTMIVLMIGRYSLLDKLIKLVIVLLAVSTFSAVLLAALKGFHPNPAHLNHFSWTNNMDIFFLIAFIGWMPAPIDVTVWQSLWTIAKHKNGTKKPQLKDILIDFKFGYIGTAFLAACFLSLGAFIFYGSGEALSPKGVVFAGQLISLYTESIGSWAHALIAIAAITTMFSTTMTCLDAYPRVMKPLRLSLMPANKVRERIIDWESWIWLAITAGGALIVMGLLGKTMQTMVDIATTLSFITAPLLAILNYKVVTNKLMPAEGRPRLWLRIYAWIGIVFLSGFTLFYIFWRFTN
ncbi:MAG: Nramp family divalent metal transporter [Bacteroidetes bacterium]|nr:Nramp family divalent metal transporter [Bacteroidota bacterium]